MSKREKVNLIRTIIACIYVIWGIVAWGWTLVELLYYNANFQYLLFPFDKTLKLALFTLLPSTPIVLFIVFHDFKGIGRMKFGKYKTIPYEINDITPEDAEEILYVKKEHEYKSEYFSGRYEIHRSKEKDVNIYFYSYQNEITPELYKIYEEYFNDFMEYISVKHERIISDYRYFYFHVIFEIEIENEYSKMMSEENLENDGYELIIPILYIKSNNKIVIPNKNDGLGQVLYKRKVESLISKMKSE